jgi:hypothetical protein
MLFEMGTEMTCQISKVFKLAPPLSEERGGGEFPVKHISADKKKGKSETFLLHINYTLSPTLDLSANILVKKGGEGVRGVLSK